ncbi:MAG TPA: DUF4402 domain-containing protein [Sphingomicrobium sp.]|nr:DUF4402 domain-containing protein [Sphingomicrobium sp.]HWJ59840.1 DUF4402 domain-containing protein [Sphingomicrobium sp.]
MVGTIRIIALLVALAAPATTNQAFAASAIIKVNAKATKPLTLTRVQDLDLGTIVLAPGTWSGAAISISQAGVFSCPNPNTSCTGAPLVATYNVSGSNNEVVKVTAPNVTLTNQSDPTQTLVLVVDSPSSVTLATGGKKGTNFSIGGSITLDSATAGGLYAGTFDVTVDYN